MDDDDMQYSKRFFLILDLVNLNATKSLGQQQN